MCGVLSYLFLFQCLAFFDEFTDLKGERLRRVVAVVAMLVTLHYLYWRVTATSNQSALIFSRGRSGSPNVSAR